MRIYAPVMPQQRTKSSRQILSYIISQLRQQLKDLGISNVACKEDKGRDTVVGVAAMQTGGRFGPLTNVMRLQI